jgi:putative transcriptional regulator
VFHVKRLSCPPAQISRRAFISVLASVAPAFATPEIAPGDTTLAGQFLIASPAMGDPRFANTVILMVRHSKAGAMGVIINRPFGSRPVAEILRAIGQDATGVNGEVRIFAGGPVQPQIGFVLHDAAYHRTDTIAIDGRVAMTSDPEILRDIARHAGPHKHLVAFGYAGWGPHQLEDELAQHAWVTEPEDPTLVFDTDRNTVWDAAMARAGRAP